MMGMTPEEWLASNTKFCKPLHMRLTPSACQTLRTRTWNVKFGEDYVGGTPSACTGCPGLQDEPPTSSASGAPRFNTIKEIADLVGTTKAFVHNARQTWLEGKKSMNGAAGRVQAWMDANEVRWEDVVVKKNALTQRRKP